MSILSLLTSHTARLQNKTQERLEEYSRPSKDFFLLIGLASAIAALGLILDSTPIIVGAMVVAPLITPIFGFSLAALCLDIRRLSLTFISILLGTILGVCMGIVVGFVAVWIDPTYVVVTNAMLSRAHPDILYFFVALLSGVAGAFAYSRPIISAAIAGIAISVAIIPPLSTVGLAVAMQSWHVASQSFSLYLFNLLGITFGSTLLFIFIGFGKETA